MLWWQIVYATVREAFNREPGLERFYTGKPYDPDLKAYTFLFRDYRPELARWTKPDPAGFPDGGNNILYVLNSPLTYLDDTGLSLVVARYWKIISQVFAASFPEDEGPLPPGYTWSGVRASTVLNSVTAPANAIAFFTDNEAQGITFGNDPCNVNWPVISISADTKSVSTSYRLINPLANNYEGTLALRVDWKVTYEE